MTKEQKERRERIAVAAMSALLSNANMTDTGPMAKFVSGCVRAADALIAELDKEPTDG